MSGWQDITARRRTLVRDDNERINARRATAYRDLASDLFGCECADSKCRHGLTLTDREYETARESPTRFVIAIDHEDPQIERVIIENDRFAIVETLPGTASRIARRTDPRASEPWHRVVDTARTGPARR